MMFHNNIVNISEKNEQAELVEMSASKLPYPTDFLHNSLLFFLWEKVKILDLKKKKMREYNFPCIGSYDKWFCI